ncbi:MAG TPA: hypothetical protein VJA22_00195, partial [Patescibacteria group bacterium]|nr:hypothetical protein [Patescibacteria group bacterium]
MNEGSFGKKYEQHVRAVDPQSNDENNENTEKLRDTLHHLQNTYEKSNRTVENFVVFRKYLMQELAKHPPEEADRVWTSQQIDFLVDELNRFTEDDMKPLPKEDQDKHPLSGIFLRSGKPLGETSANLVAQSLLRYPLPSEPEVGKGAPKSDMGEKHGLSTRIARNFPDWYLNSLDDLQNENVVDLLRATFRELFEFDQYGDYEDARGDIGNDERLYTRIEQIFKNNPENTRNNFALVSLMERVRHFWLVEDNMDVQKKIYDMYRELRDKGSFFFREKMRYLVSQMDSGHMHITDEIQEDMDLIWKHKSQDFEKNYSMQPFYADEFREHVDDVPVHSFMNITENRYGALYNGNEPALFFARDLSLEQATGKERRPFVAIHETAHDSSSMIDTLHRHGFGVDGRDEDTFDPWLEPQPLTIHQVLEREGFSKKGMSQEQYSVLVENYLLLLDLVMRNKVEEALGISLSEYSVREQVQLLNFLSSKLPDDVEKVKIFLDGARDDSARKARVRSFLSLETDEANGSRLLELGE